MTHSAGPALRSLHDEYRDRVDFLTLYVREAHPGDRYVQPQDEASKIAQARAYADRDGVTWPVLVDDIDGSLHRQLDPKPNAWYLIAGDGTVAARGLWANAVKAVHAALDAAADGRPIAEPQDESLLLPMLRGTGEMWSTLRAAGPLALRDVAIHAPPMALTAALAGHLPLRSPLARGTAAMGLMALGVFGAVGLARSVRG